MAARLEIQPLLPISATKLGMFRPRTRSAASESISENDAAMGKLPDDYRSRRQVVAESPEPIRSALKHFMVFDRGVISRSEFRWLVFQHIRREDLSLLEESLRKLLGEPPHGIPHTEFQLQDLLNDADWGFPLFALRRADEETTIAEEEAIWERHRAGIAAVKDYLEGGEP